MVLHHRAARRQLGSGPRILIRNPHAAHLLGKEGPGLGRTYRADQTPKLHQEHEGQEHQACQRDPGHARSPDSALPKVGIQTVGVRQHQTLRKLYDMMHKGAWKVLFKASEVPPPTSEDRGLHAVRPPSPVSFQATTGFSFPNIFMRKPQVMVHICSGLRGDSGAD